MSETRPFKSPEKSKEAQAYWEGLARGEIVLQRCANCDTWAHPPRARCRNCQSDELVFVPVSGLGEIYTYTVTYRPLSEEFRPDLPLIIAYVTLDEGPRLVSWIRHVKPEDVRVGMRVVAEFERIDDETTLHRFRPIQSPEE